MGWVIRWCYTPFTCTPPHSPCLSLPRSITMPAFACCLPLPAASLPFSCCPCKTFYQTFGDMDRQTDGQDGLLLGICLGFLPACLPPCPLPACLACPLAFGSYLTLCLPCPTLALPPAHTQDWFLPYLAFLEILPAPPPLLTCLPAPTLPMVPLTLPLTLTLPLAPHTCLHTLPYPLCLALPCPLCLACTLTLCMPDPSWFLPCIHIACPCFAPCLACLPALAPWMVDWTLPFGFTPLPVPCWVPPVGCLWFACLAQVCLAVSGSRLVRWNDSTDRIPRG